MRFWQRARDERQRYDEAAAVCERVGLGARIHTLAGSLAHGEQRQLEVGLALATTPKLLLLDEPMAGMWPDESERMVQLRQSLRGEATILLVEHDMGAVFRPVSYTHLDVYKRQALPDMLAARQGRIVNIASTAGQRGYAYVAAYVAAKHGVVGLTRSLALELAPKGIPVNAVCPGYTETEILRAVPYTHLDVYKRQDGCRGAHGAFRHWLRHQARHRRRD